MTKWIIFLRAIGVLLLFALAGDLILFTESPQRYDFQLIYPILVTVIERLALVILCFSAAAGLVALRRMDARSSRAMAARATVMQVEKEPEIPPLHINYPPINEAEMPIGEQLRRRQEAHDRINKR